MYYSEYGHYCSPEFCVINVAQRLQVCWVKQKINSFNSHCSKGYTITHILTIIYTICKHGTTFKTVIDMRKTNIQAEQTWIRMEPNSCIWMTFKSSTQTNITLTKSAYNTKQAGKLPQAWLDTSSGNSNIFVHNNSRKRERRK